MTLPLLQIAGLTVRFGGLTAVETLDLSVAAASLHGLIGPNGAGKTTAFNLITGAVRRSAGAISLDGARIETLPPTQGLSAGSPGRSRTSAFSPK